MFKTLFTRWLTRPEPPHRAGPDRYRQLETLQQRHSFIDVKFHRLQRSFQSIVLELRPEQGYLLVDELYPPAGREELLEGDTAEITSRAPDIALNFFSRLLLRELVDGSPAYRLELPEDIGVQLRRHAFRVYVEREAGLGIDIPGADGAPLDARIVNLSADGIKLSIQGDVSAHLERHPLLERCLIRLPGDADIECSIDTRSVYLMRSPARHTLAAGRIKIETAPQRAKLDQFLAAVQRKQRRREARLS